MGEQTNIAWTSRTWNPWQGCHKVSSGCRSCYMFSEKIRYGQTPNVVVRSKPPTFNAPLKWKDPGFVFTCSWSDWFIEEAKPWRDEAWDIVRRTPHLTYQILTKRPERIPEALPADWGAGWPNVWLGVSAENQETAEERIPTLLAMPAALRFVSAEPLLESFDVARWLRPRFAGDPPEWRRAVHTPAGPLPGLDWLIVGGESGSGARPFNLGWARALIEQCRAAGVPVFCKQLGALPVLDEDRWRGSHPVRILSALKGRRAPPGTVAIALEDPKGAAMDEWPVDLRVQEWPGRPSAPIHHVAGEEMSHG